MAVASPATIDLRRGGIWQTNSTVIASAGRVLLVDPGYFPRELDELRALADARGTVEAVVFTHGHWDHVAGWARFPEAAVWGSAALAADVGQGSPAARKNLDAWRDFDGRWYVDRGEAPGWPVGIRAIADGQELRVGDCAIEAYSLAGHSHDGLALLLPVERVLLCGDHASPCEIPFVEDLAAYGRTLSRLIAMLPRVERVIPGHGGPLPVAEARSILEADARYLDALAECSARGDVDAALAIALPRAADVPGMREHHVENCANARLRRD